MAADLGPSLALVYLYLGWLGKLSLLSQRVPLLAIATVCLNKNGVGFLQSLTNPIKHFPAENISMG
jgi:hypothetical protein